MPCTRAQEALGIAAAACAQPALATAGAAAPRGRAGGAGQPGKPAAAAGCSSRFRGVTKHRRSGRWEAHCWVKQLGRQVYLGALPAPPPRPVSLRGATSWMYSRHVLNQAMRNFCLADLNNQPAPALSL
jgi:hypothetical protein